MMAVYIYIYIGVGVLYYNKVYFANFHAWFTLDMAHTMQDLIRQRVVPPSFHVVEGWRRSSAQLLVPEQSPIIPPSSDWPHQVWGHHSSDRSVLWPSFSSLYMHTCPYTQPLYKKVG